MKKIIYPLLLLILVIFFIFEKIHPSSIGMYYQYFFGNKKDPNLVFGQPRAIRSDEWLVGTPKIIGQVKAGFPVVNENIGLGEVMPVQGCLPYKHWRVAFCPNMWGFFFLPLENAYSLMWWLPNFLMILAVYFFGLFLFKNIFLSIFASLIFFFTPFHQWWSHFLSTYLSYGLFFILFFLKSLEKKGFYSLIYLILSNYFLISFAFILYPPFQVASFYVFGGFLLGYLLSKKIFNKKLFLYTFLSIIITLLTVSFFYFEFRETINIIRNTVYPGKRFVANTLGNFTFLINGFYNIQLLDDAKGVGPFANQSEASNFFLLSLFALPVYWWVIVDQIRKRKIDYVFLSLNIVFLILLIWFLFPIPSLLAKITFFYLVPQKRAIIGVGIAAYFLMFYYLAKVRPKKDFPYLYLTILSALLIFFVNLYLGFWLKFNFPLFIQNNLKITLISSFSSFLILLLLFQRIKLFLITFLLFSILSSYRVNPLYTKLGFLGDDNFYFDKLIKISKNIKNYYIVNYGSGEIEGVLISKGLRLLDGWYYYPQIELIKKLDPRLDNKFVWNRYGHIDFTVSNLYRKQFYLTSNDSYAIVINPCNKMLKSISNKPFLIISDFDLGEGNPKCLKSLGKLFIGKKIFYIYYN